MIHEEKERDLTEIRNVRVESKPIPAKDMPEKVLFFTENLVSGDVQKKIEAYEFFNQNEIMPNVDGLDEIVIADIDSDDISLVSQAFILSFKFLPLEKNNILSKILHCDYCDPEFNSKLLYMLTEYLSVFTNEEEMDTVTQNTLRLIISRATKLCNGDFGLAPLAAELINKCILSYDNREFQTRLVSEFIRYGDINFYFEAYNFNKESSIINLLYVISMLFTELVNPSDIIGCFSESFSESSGANKYLICLILSRLSFHSTEIAAAVAPEYFDFIVNSLNQGTLDEKKGALILLSILSKYIDDIPCVIDMFKSAPFGDLIIEIHESISLSITHICLESLQLMIRHGSVPLFEDFQGEDQIDEFYSMIDSLSELEKTSKNDEFLETLMEFKKVKASELAVDIVTLIEYEED